MYDIADLDLAHDDRDEQLAELRAAAGLGRDDVNDLWYVARHADVAEVSHNPEVFSSAGGVTYFESTPLSFVTMDEPEHGRLRRIVSRQFTPKMVKGLRETTRAYVSAAIDTTDRTEPVDIVDSVSAPVTLRVIADMLGIPPTDLPQVREWTDTMMDAGGRLDEPGVLESATECFVAWSAYVDEQVAVRLRSPGSDLLSLLAHSDDERLDPEELAMFATTLMVAGNETTRHTSTRGLHALLTHPDQRRLLMEDPSRLPAATEEILRWTSVARGMMRTVTTDSELAGTALSAGDRVMLLYPSANRDETVFEDGGHFRIDRQPNPHLSFGIGTHFCLGANLARMEVEVIVGTVLDRCPSVVLSTPPVHRSNGLVDGVASMRVVLGDS